MEDLMLKIENVSKQYKLGQIGGTTLKEELQRKRAKLHGKEDPTKKIGSKDYTVGETFMALQNVSFSVKKGERVGIIGHNGAGKSTLLKLISRVTAPTEGAIGLNGRITSMLEVGTGFHGELTGRENIYMNGAILGMTKKEIDSKIEEIIDFSEVRQFIDTPVKRYSSGMYVKLAFSVAAHLDSEIMIMDEVLAVGDMAFQKKCIDKMNEVSCNQSRTILYVSHNMNTIRQLCERVIVLESGKVIFDGDVEDGISLYMHVQEKKLDVDIELSNDRMPHLPENIRVKMMHLLLMNKSVAMYEHSENIEIQLTLLAFDKIENMSLRIEILSKNGDYVGVSMINDFSSIGRGEEKIFRLCCDFRGLIPGHYSVCLVLYEKNILGRYVDLDAVYPAFNFVVEDNDDVKIKWNPNWGHIKFKDIKLL